MTLNVGPGAAAPTIQSKPGDRGVKSAKAPAGFNEALADKADRKTDRKDAGHQPTRGARPGLERLVARLGKPADERTPLLTESDTGPEENFDAILEGVLLDSKPLEAAEPAEGLLVSTEPETGGPMQDDALLPQAADAPADDTVVQDDAHGVVNTTGQHAVQTAAETTPTATAMPMANVAVAAGRNGDALPGRQSRADNALAAPRQQGPAPAGGGVFRTEPPANPQDGAARATEPVLSGAAGRFPSGGRGEGSTGRDGLQRAISIPGADALSGRVSVLGFNAALAPAVTMNPLLGQTTSGLVSAMEGDPTWRAAAMAEGAQAAQRGTSLSAGVNTLKIQLHPIELGMVTARLTVSGEQLSVEIQVETTDARQKLAADSESILKALRAVGYDVDKVTIAQSPSSTSGQGQPASSGRDPFASSQQAQDDGDARGQQGGRGAGRQDNDGARHGAGETAADRAGGGLYI